VVPVADAAAELVAATELLVVGGPTHFHGMSTARTRTMAAELRTRTMAGCAWTQIPPAGAARVAQWHQ
jgi:hypothetical protein